ncbi:MAG: flagellar biosynthesis anti-sigma factor FlgM [Nitrospirae bacterium]|nr:flagellar biosynthesis anti-sigma factor FlgM [Nitrospirota bacterium]
MKIIGQNIPKNPENQAATGVNVVRTTSLVKGKNDGDADDVNKPGYSDDRIEVSDRAKEFNNIKTAVKGMPDIREEKVKEVSDQVKNGTYRVDAESVASGLVKETIADRLIK